MRDISAINISPCSVSTFPDRMLNYLEGEITNLTERVNRAPILTDTGRDITENTKGKLIAFIEIRHFVEKEFK